MTATAALFDTDARTGVVEDFGVVRVKGTERTRPTATVATLAESAIVVAIASGRQKDGVSVTPALANVSGDSAPFVIIRPFPVASD